jgi:WD40 repeat protein
VEPSGRHTPADAAIPRALDISYHGKQPRVDRCLRFVIVPSVAEGLVSVVQVWDLGSGTLLQTLRFHVRAVTSLVAFESAGSMRLVSGGSDCAIAT